MPVLSLQTSLRVLFLVTLPKVVPFQRVGSCLEVAPPLMMVWSFVLGWRQDPFLSALPVSSGLVNEAVSEPIRASWNPDGPPEGSPHLQCPGSVSPCFPLILHEMSPLLALNRFKGTCVLLGSPGTRSCRCCMLLLQMLKDALAQQTPSGEPRRCQVLHHGRSAGPPLTFFREGFRGQNHRHSLEWGSMKEQRREQAVHRVVLAG